MLVGAIVTVSCSRPSAPVTLRFVVPEPEVSAWVTLIKQFEATHDGISIELANLHPTNPVEANDSDSVKAAYVPTLTQAADDDAAVFDLVYLDVIWLPEFVEEGWLMELSGYFPPREELEDSFLRSEVINGYYEDRLYRIPFRTDVGVLYYRKDLLEQVNERPPETFEDLIRISNTLQEQGVPWGYLWQGRQTEAIAAMFIEVLHGFGGFWIRDDEVGLNQEAAIQAVEFLRDTIRTGISPPGVTTYEESVTREIFRSGDAVFMRNWPDVWADANLPTSPVRGRIGVRAMVHSATVEHGGAAKGGWGFGVAHNTAHPEEAVKAIQFFTSAAAQRQFTLDYGAVPSQRSLFFDPAIVSRYNHYPQLLNILDRSWVSRPRIPQYSEASCILRRYLHDALKDTYTSRDAMNLAAAETRQLLATGISTCRP